MGVSDPAEESPPEESPPEESVQDAAREQAEPAPRELRRLRPPARARLERMSCDVLPLSEAAQRRIMQARRMWGL